MSRAIQTQAKSFEDFLKTHMVGIESQEILRSFTKTWEVFRLRGWKYPTAMVSISGGADSDIMLDMIERVGHPETNVKYVFFDTGLEFQATKDHLADLENWYGIKVARFPAKVRVPLGCKKYGVPFLSKHISKYISRLQKHGFAWEDGSFEDLYAKYPNCKAALRWWCNEWGENSRLNINNRPFLREFMIENPPTFRISDGCCRGAKKDTAHVLEKEFNPDITCTGIRKSEGGERFAAYKSCFDDVFDGADQFRPLFWMKNADKTDYERAFGIRHSRCYSDYGLIRTGCACCPFGRYFEDELVVAEAFEPKLYFAAQNVFGKSYEYTRAYKQYARERGARA